MDVSLVVGIAEFPAHDGPTLLEVITERQELTIPPSTFAEQAKGFALYTLRTVLSGRGAELINLAREPAAADLTGATTSAHS